VDPATPPLPPHEILEEIGRGRSAVVYRARETASGRVVVLKVLAADAFRGAAAERFFRDAMAASHLRLPYIVPLYSAGLHEDRPAYTMQLAAKGRLSERIGQFRDLRAAADLIEKLARGAEAAHGHALLQGDLKPSAVFFDDHDQPMMSEFGLSPAASSAQPADDVRGLGAILYELLTGRPPAEGVRPYRLRPDLDFELEAIVLRCLRKRPEDRYPSARALADDLERWLRSEPTAARPETWAQRLLRRVARALGGDAI
jgi:serine/threonine-protein kinase